MLAIGFRYLAGNYHATPWGRHVNEADVEWPPSPWRIIRAIIATWHHKADSQRFPIDRLKTLVESLCEQLPVYCLPPAVHTHKRHYMPQFKATDKSLIFDAFVRLDKDAEVIAVWENLDLPLQERDMLDYLLPLIGYMGRSESWVEARRIENWNGKPNCRYDWSEIDDKGNMRESIILFAPLSNSEYQSARKELALRHQAKGAKGKPIAQTLPDSLLDAVSLDTSDLQKTGWSRPPAAQKIRYLRPGYSLRPLPRPVSQSYPNATTARLVLAGRPLPRIEDTVKVGEWIRRAVIGKAGWMLGKDCVPIELSGHNLPEGNCHEHAFWLPEDSDKDGHIDHVLIHASYGFSDKAQSIIAALRVVKGKDGMEWRTALEGLGNVNDFSEYSEICQKSKSWISITPWLHPWHIKKKFGIEEQLHCECKKRNELPELINIQWLHSVSAGKDRELGPLDFYRFRRKRGLTQPDTHGRFVRLTFAEPVQGPLALGFGCHFGLGFFKPYYE